MPEWRESIGIMLRKAGELDKKTLFLFVDTQIKLEGFVEDVNSLLNTGEVIYNLFIYNTLFHEFYQFLKIIIHL